MAEPVSDDAVRQRVVRVFVSSTFRDMHAERDELVKRVFPQLRKLCEERDVVWSEVDLRWGVTDEQVAEGRVLPVCLAEIEQCRPFFIGLLGERYGWVPDRYPEAIARQEPWILEHRGKSVTELEILHGVLNDPEMRAQAVFYFRDPAYVASLPADQRLIFDEQPLPEDIARMGFEAAERLSTQRRQKLADLKDRIRRSGLHVYEGYSAPRQLGEWVLRDLTQLIDRRFPPDTRPNPLDQEQFEHATFARLHSRNFVGRDAWLSRLHQHRADGGPPLVVQGEAGMGKTALMAKWVADVDVRRSKPKSPWRQLLHAFTDRRNETVWLYHFVSASDSSADWKALVRRILEELSRQCPIRRRIPDEPEELRTALAEWLQVAARRKRIVLVLDGLDQLDDVDRARNLVWLPAKLPPRVRLICTTRPGPTCNEMIHRGWPMVTLPPFTVDERAAMVVSFLRSFGKELAARARELLVDSSQTGNPLFLATILDELRLFGEHERLAERIQHYLSAPDVEELYLRVLERYDQDYESDRPGLVRDAFTSIWGARHGLEEGELLAMLGHDDQPLPRLIWSPLHLAAREGMLTRSSAMKFAHDGLRRAILRRYLESPAQRHMVHRRLADFFRRQDLTRRGLSEQLWQLAQLTTSAEGQAHLAADLSDLWLLQRASEQSPDWIQEWTRLWSAAGGVSRATDGYLAAAQGLLERFADDRTAVDAVRQAAMLLHHMGDSAGAERLLAQLPGSTGTTGTRNGADEDDELGELSQRGRALQMQNRFDEAVATFERGADICRRRFGRNSAEVVVFTGSIAGVLHQQGRDQEALPLFEHALRVLEQKWGADHRETLNLRSNLALCLNHLGRYDEARRLYQQDLELLEQLVGRNDPEIVATLVGLASVESSLGQYEQATERLQRGLAIREAALGPDHPRTLNIVHNLAAIYGANQQPARAASLFERCLEATRRTAGERHTDFAVSNACLAEAYTRLQRFDEALSLFIRAIEVFEDVAPNHPYLTTTRHNLADWHLQKGQLPEARKIYQRVVDDRTRILGPRHPETARSLWSLGYACTRAGDDAAGERLMRQALDIFTSEVGDHRDVLGVHLQLEQLARRRRDVAKASAERHRAEEMAARLGVKLAPADDAQRSAAAAPQQSVEPPIEQEVLERTKQEIQRLFAQTIEIAHTNPETAVFFREWLSRAVQAMGAHGGAVWSVDPLGKIELDVEWHLPAECRPENVEAERHFRLLRKVAITNNAYCFFPGNSLNNSPDVVNPTPYTLVLAHMQAEEASLVAEIVQRADAGRQSGAGLARFLAELCRVAIQYLQHRYGS